VGKNIGNFDSNLMHILIKTLPFKTMASISRQKVVKIAQKGYTRH
jgi:hypothetical protein